MRQARQTKLLTISLSPELYSEIQQMTDELGISVSAWFREAADLILTELKSDTSVIKLDSSKE